MKIVWGLKSIPEFNGLDRLSAKEAWMAMYRKVRSQGDCKFAPILSVGLCAVVMLLAALLTSFIPFLHDLVRFAVLIVFAGSGGHLAGVLAMSLNYNAGRKYLITRSEQSADSSPH